MYPSSAKNRTSKKGREYPASKKVTHRSAATPQSGRQAAAHLCGEGIVHGTHSIKRPAQSGTSNRIPLGQEAVGFAEIRFDQERVRAYCIWRRAGKSPEEARALAPYGMHYASVDDGERTRIRALLDEYGISPSPLCWPRYDVELDRPLAKCQVLGSGTFNTVYAIELQGTQYAFKPSHRPDKNSDNFPFSNGGWHLGLTEDSFFPELRYLAAVRIADSLRLAGPQGVVGHACVAVVNGVPGILSERVFGKSEGRELLCQEKVAPDSNEGRLARAVLYARGRSPEEKRRATHAIGLYQIDADADDNFYLTGVVGKRSLGAKERYASTSYNLSVLRAQVLGYLAGLPDLHAGNVMAERGPQGEYRARIIDLDEALVPRDPAQLQFKDQSDRWVLSTMFLPVKALPKDLRCELQTERCRIMNQALRVELKDYLPDACLNQFARREEALRAADLPGFFNEMTWEPDTDLEPQNWLLDRIIGFSTHEFGDSEDSSSVSGGGGSPGIAARFTPAPAEAQATRKEPSSS